MAATAVPITRWSGCYSESWQDLIVPESFAHPAKAARGLSHRIYRHLLESGYVRPGDTVLDPFAGIGGFCLDAMTYGLRYVGVELEPRFVALGQQNLELWRQRYGFTGGTIVQGDSRRLREVLAGAQVGCVVGSPPYAESLHHNESVEAEISRMVRNGVPVTGGAQSRTPSAAHYTNKGYGTTPGQLGAMPPGVVVSSPPYEGTPLSCFDSGVKQSGGLGKQYRLGANPGGQKQVGTVGYGTSPAQLGNTAGDTFWSASSQIMFELSAILPPGAVCAWVLKAYVSKKAIVPFPDQWRALCESHGFQLVEEIHASLVEDHGTQEGLFGESTKVTTEKKSFFRRLAEKKGSPRIDHETVLIVRKDGSGAGMCCVSSPPWHNSQEGASVAGPSSGMWRGYEKGFRPTATGPIYASSQESYGTTPGNLGNLPVGRM